MPPIDQAKPLRGDLFSFEEVHEEEWTLIHEARSALHLDQHASKEDCVGLALSGGGIRSATFCLGVLQALARKDRLVQIDYLSTVSGGGYVGCWLSAWIHQKGFSRVSDDLKRASAVDSGEAPEVTWLRRYSNYLAPKLGMLSIDSMALVATWFRNVLLNLVIVVSFLALVFLLPRLLLEPTMYAMRAGSLHRAIGYAAAWIGFFILPLAISLNLSAYLAQDVKRRVALLNRTAGVVLTIMVPGALTALFGSIALFSTTSYFRDHPWDFLVGAGAMLGLAGLFWALYHFLERRSWMDFFTEGVVFVLAYSCALATGAGLLGYFAEAIVPIGQREVERAANLLTFGPPAIFVTFGVVGSVIVGLVGTAYSERSREWWARMNAWFIIVGIAWLAICVLAFYAAPAGAWVQQQLGNWFSALLGAGWLGGLLVSLLAPKPGSSESILSKLGRTGLNLALAIVVAGLLFGVAAILGVSVGGLGVNSCEAAKDCRASVTQRTPVVSIDVKSESGKTTAAAVTTEGEFAKLQIETAPGEPTVATLATKAASTDFADYVKKAFDVEHEAIRTCVGVFKDSKESDHQTKALRRGAARQDGERGCTWWDPEVRANHSTTDLYLDLTVTATAASLLVLLVFGFRVSVNKFSLHSLYKNRLTRCYLGASRQDRRRPHPFTGFDEDDDVALSRLRATEQHAPSRPFHIITAAVNITQGRNLAWQERKAASFTMTPLHCGFRLGPSTGDSRPTSLLSSGLQPVGGYRDSIGWASRGDERKAFTLGSAMATSGAAVSTNSGKSTSPALAFIATIFNARLGRWSPNPLGDKWLKSGPRAGLVCLLKELFGYSTEVSDYIHLSDGGHFDNTGAYELVRRRCKTILIVDATADVSRSMSDLANLVRKCRIDFGVRIHFNVDELGADRPKQSSRKGYVFGTIEYEPGRPGRLVVIKPTLVAPRNLGVDIFSYARSSASFPHQSTIDQFFSESQFESYRELGERITTACIKDKRCPL